MSIVPYIERPPSAPLDPTIALLGEPEGAVFDFIGGKAWIVDKKNPANTMLRDIGDVLTNPGASATKPLRRTSGKLESAPWWEKEFDAAGKPMGMRVEEQRVNASTRSEFQTGLNAGTSARGGQILETSFPHLSENKGIAFSVATETTYVYKAHPAPAVGDTWTFSFFIEMDDGLAPNIGGAGAANGSDHPFAPFIHNALQPMSNWVVTDCGNKLYRVAVTHTAVATNSHIGVLKYPGNNARTFKISGYQIEKASFASSYTKTDAFAVTRAADQPQIPTGFLPYNSAAGTLILDGMAYNFDTDTRNFSLGLYGPNSSLDYAALLKQDLTGRNARLYGGTRGYSGNVNPQNFMEILTDFTFPVAPSPKKTAVSWGPDGHSVATGVTGYAQDFPSLWTPFNLSRLEFRPADGIMWYRSAIYIPRKLAANELLQRVRA
ncbi:hypothetical protein JYU29_05600 [Tianweitania sp. BSSL-BM11]|uniref:Uncharacterized protein n=1 Tax=Tianweitania aestuarii TaxID=2814886 RepID=A0ABS5RSY1_9HYPH|nr:hypothetical protein [Tianweitania aestuarii]MBS9720160.1 hypothetical protein [Tianweitania aestuarii]